jgi:hypothetical protein
MRSTPLSIGPRLLLLSALASSCGDCSCDKKKTGSDHAAEMGTSAPVEAGPSRSERMITARGRMMGLVRSQGALGSADIHVQDFLRTGDKEGVASAPEMTTRRALSMLVGETMLAGLRVGGNVELAMFAPLKEGEARGFVAVLPVEDLGKLLTDMGASGVEGSEEPDRLMRWSGPSGALYARLRPFVLEGDKNTDEGVRLLVSNEQGLAELGAELITEQLQRQEYEVWGRVWPAALGMPERYGRFAAELRQRLAAAGHNLLPARANLLNVQAVMYDALSRSGAWPEHVDLSLTFKVREGKTSTARLYASFAAPPSSALDALYHALEGHRGGNPPRAKGGLLTLRARLDRERYEELLGAIFPSGWRALLGAMGEDNMRVLEGVASELLDHDRGATLVALYPQRQPLSAEVLIGWEAMDVEALPGHAETFHRTLIERFWVPLFLADPASIKIAPYKGRGGKLVGQAMTFEPGVTGTTRMGVCWGLEAGYYYAYYGADPCARLEELAEGPEEAVQPPLTVSADVRALLDVAYLPPGKELRDGFEEARWEFQVNTRPSGVLELDMTQKSGAAAAAVLRGADPLLQAWTVHREVDLGELMQRTGAEQAIYQEPGLMVIGPPGLLGTLPPGFYMGLPFALPPTPASQLREAMLGPDAPEPKPLQATDKKKPEIKKP